MKASILICLPFWNGDKNDAYEVCRIAAGLQSHHVGNVAHFMLVPRQDCAVDMNMAQILGAKFHTLTHQSTSPLRGWPAGPNGMFSSCMIHISNTLAHNYECIYWLEPDCVPIRPNWFWDLVIAWRGRHPTSLVVGSRSDCHGDGTGDHISGCALYDPHIARKMPQLMRCDQWAWDYQYRSDIVRVGGPTGLIQNRYKQKNLPAGVIEEPGVVLIHGCKDASVLNAVKAKYRIS